MIGLNMIMMELEGHQVLPVVNLGWTIIVSPALVQLSLCCIDTPFALLA